MACATATRMADEPCASKIADIESLPGIPDQIDYSHQPFEMERALHYENTSVDDIYKRWEAIVDPKDLPALEAMARALLEADPRSDRDLNKALAPLRKKYKMGPRKSQLLHAYRGLVRRNDVQPSKSLESAHDKGLEVAVGVLVVTVLTSPYRPWTARSPSPSPASGTATIVRTSPVSPEVTCETSPRS